MSDRDQRTEQPTQQRLRKTREDGRFPVSREFVAAVQLSVFFLMLSAAGPAWAQGLAEWLRSSLRGAFRPGLQLDPGNLAPVASYWLRPAILLLGMTAVGLLAQFFVTGFGIATKRLVPDWNQLNPASRLSGLPRKNLNDVVAASLLLPLLLGFVAWAVLGHLAAWVESVRLGLPSAVALVARSVEGIVWTCVFALLVWGAIDLFRQKRRYLRDLRMTKQEIRDELRQNEGNPEIKMRMRRMRMDLLRRRMMSEVPKATAVIVNPTHYAVAVRYQVQSMAAPKVVAKGKNYLALRIREKAILHQVPVIENPPLARALYKNVEVGQEIPPQLYKAVAEILAYLHRLMHGRLPGS